MFYIQIQENCKFHAAKNANKKTRKHFSDRKNMLKPLWLIDNFLIIWLHYRMSWNFHFPLEWNESYIDDDFYDLPLD